MFRAALDAVADIQSDESRRYRFAVGAYDANRPLVIDPLLQSTYLGGDGNDTATALATD